jgi:hypothetical protein
VALADQVLKLQDADRAVLYPVRYTLDQPRLLLALGLGATPVQDGIQQWLLEQPGFWGWGRVQ